MTYNISEEYFEWLNNNIFNNDDADFSELLKRAPKHIKKEFKMYEKARKKYDLQWKKGGFDYWVKQKWLDNDTRIVKLKKFAPKHIKEKFNFFLESNQDKINEGKIIVK